MNGRTLVVLGSGLVARTALFLIRENWRENWAAQKVVVITSDASTDGVIDGWPVVLVKRTVTNENYVSVLSEHARCGDVLLNLAVDIGTGDLITYCQATGILYVDSCTDVWGDEKPVGPVTFNQRLGVLRTGMRGTGYPTALTCHGANPGLVSHFLKVALRELAASLGMSEDGSLESSASLSRRLGVSAIHITDRDTQGCSRDEGPGPANTWSLPAFMDEMAENASIVQAGRSVEYEQPAMSVGSRSWSPSSGEFVGHVVPHEEIYSITSLLSDPGMPPAAHQPSVRFVYEPCPAARSTIASMKSGSMNGHLGRIMAAEIDFGAEELGILLVRSGARQAFWYGSTLTIQTARELVPFANATAVQVAAGVISGLAWVLRHPQEGFVEPEDIDSETILADSLPYLGKITAHRMEWPPPRCAAPASSSFEVVLLDTEW